MKVKIDKSKLCSYEYSKDGRLQACGKPSIVAIGKHGVCAEHAEMVIDHMSSQGHGLDFQLGTSCCPRWAFLDRLNELCGSKSE